MRLRKHASKLLGWAYSSQFHSSSFPEAQHCWPPPPEAAGADSGELHCRLNQSPWDAVENPQFTNSQEEFAKSNEEEMEMDGVVKSGCNPKQEEEDEESLEEIVKHSKEKNDGNEKTPPRNFTEAEAEAETAGMKCKKTDGKGWHCKRAAQIPHSLCSYHLTQVRSYRARFEDQIYSNGGRGNGKRCRPKPASAGETGGVASNYYYYSVMGPWWGKRRGPIDERGSSESDVSAREHDDDNTDINVGVVDDEEEDGEGRRCDHVTYTKKMPLKKKKKKKRGRKPMKARSLKSLL